MKTLQTKWDDTLGNDLGTDLSIPSSPFITKRRKPQKGGARKKVKFDRSVSPTDRVLAEGHFDEIRYILWKFNEDLWGTI